MRQRALVSDRSARGSRRRPRAACAATALTALAAAAVAAFGAAAPAMADDCPNTAVRAQSNSAGLPDCRAYELVSNPFKQGFEPLPLAFTDSGSVAYYSIGSFADNGLGTNTSPYLATRTSTNWATLAVSPSGPEWAGAYGAAARSADLRSTLFRMRRAEQSAEVADFYVRGPDGVFREVGPAVNPASLTPSSPGTWPSTATNLTIDGASADLSHIVWARVGGQKFSGTTDASQVYEYVGVGASAPRAVGLDNSGDEITQCGPVFTGSPEMTRNRAVSTDGRVIFVTADTSCSGGAKQLWARVDGSVSYEVSETHCARSVGDPGGACNDPANAQFEGANAEGTRVYFTTSQQLVNGDTDQTKDLYACDLPAGVQAPVGRANPCSSFSEVSGAATDADVQGVVRVSDDGSRVYFVAHGVLAANRGANDLAAVAGEDNLYVWQKNAAHPAGTTTFVGKLEAGDHKAWEQETVGNPGREAESTDDGRVLVIATSAQLVAADTDTARDIYRYDADSGAIDRVSTGPQGGNTDGFDAVIATFGSYSTADPTSRPRYVMTADGGLIVFTTSEALVAGDVNTSADAYAWQDGHVSLISSGRPPRAAVAFLPVAWVSSSGRDIYFNTRDQLTPADGDTLPDMYDARVDGGFAFAQPVPCSGEACQTPSGPAPPASTTTSGQSGAAPVLPVFSLAAVTAAQRGKLAKTGTLTLKVTSNTPAFLSAIATAMVAHRQSRVASARRTAAPGLSSLALKLSTKARAQLVADGKLTVKVVVSSSKVAATTSTTLKLTHTKTKKKAERATSKRRSPQRPANTMREAKS